ncbi:MAG: hypothetical protein SO135_08715 [Sphaerochaetaceae bacterium]|nr:hypothetical protein [Sphaerochaetaceae bacterium]
MKKNISIFLCLFLCAAMLFAYDNKQEIFNIGNDVFEAIKYIYVISGKALPSTTGPWSNAELQLMLSKVDRDSLPSGARNSYDYAASELAAEPKNVKIENLGLSFGLELTPEGYFHTNTDKAFQGRDNWIYNSLDQEQFLNFTWETWATKHIFAYFEFAVRNNRHLNNGFGSTSFLTNIPMFSMLTLNMNDLDMNMPDKCYFSIGGNNWNLEAGRDRLSWGAGETGNLAISDNIPYHNLARFTTFFSSFKYTFLTSFFPHPLNYADANSSKWGTGSQADADKGISFYMAHRVEGRFFRDKLNITITEAIMYMAEDGHVDPRVLNPMMFFHDYYIRSNANSTLLFEADFTIFKGLNIYAQVIVDEFALPGEPYGPNEDWMFPTSIGYLAGLKGYFSLGNGIFFSSAEFAMTSPFLYLRYGTSENDKTKGGYGISYVVALRTFHPDFNVTYDEFFMGYQYGGDAIVANANAGWKIFDKFRIEGNFFFMAHGTYDKWTRWSQIGTNAGLVGFEDAQTPTHTHANTTNNKDDNASLRNSVSYTYVAGLNASYNILKSMKVFVQGDYIIINNYGNISGVTQNDFQLAFGLHYTL